MDAMLTRTSPTPALTGAAGPASPAGWQAPSGPATPRGAAVPPLEPVGFLRGPFATRTWREFGYLVLALPWSIVGLVYVLMMISLTLGLLVTVVGGTGVLAIMVVGARGVTGIDRGLARGLLRVPIDSPTPFRRRQGFWGAVWSMISDGAGWRAIAYMVLQFPLAVMTFVVSVTSIAAPLAAITHFAWGRYLPAQEGSDGLMHSGSQIIEGVFIDTPMRNVGFALLGVFLLFVGTAVTRGVAHLHRMLASALLGPTAASMRVARLEQSRGRAVEDADSTLRRIERNLHDGTQARLVAIAMQLGEAKEQAVSSGAGAELTQLISDAHAATKDTLLELRELARGIHPPALDNGLAVALETLAARSPLPVTVDIDLPGPPAPRPAEAIETIAYFCVTELLTNTIKHASASGMYIVVEAGDGVLNLRVRDDGTGGAVVLVPDADGHHSGLAGLTERVGSVDGDFVISSPVGGPTLVTITLPMHV